MHIMKIKGSGKIPDYLQIRDNEFTLIAYFRAEKYIKSMQGESLDNYIDIVGVLIDSLNYGEMKYIEDIEK